MSDNINANDEIRYSKDFQVAMTQFFGNIPRSVHDVNEYNIEMAIDKDSVFLIICPRHQYPWIIRAIRQ